MTYRYFARRSGLSLLKYLWALALCCLLAGCDVHLPTSSDSGSSCQMNCALGSRVNGLSVLVEPEAGITPLLNAISGARKSVWLEIYLLTNKRIIEALEEDANRGIDVRVMLEQHPFGGGSPPPGQVIDKLNAAGVRAQFSNPEFKLTHEKGLVIDNTTAYIMTTNFTSSALGTSSFTKNREYDIVDRNTQDVQAIASIFLADWDHSPASFNDPNLVVSPVNARYAFPILIGSARETLLIENEEMNDALIEQALVTARHQGVKVEVILPHPKTSTIDSNQDGIATLEQGGVSVREDGRLYMHAKIMVVDGREAFVGSENISAQSMDANRELGIIVAESNVLNTLQQTFQVDWDQSDVML